jgi:hypothetical protein
LGVAGGGDQGGQQGEGKGAHGNEVRVGEEAFRSIPFRGDEPDGGERVLVE